jgi:2-polyprenyl-3-methyl-5-hydroxy-6-metoxy-1,4-benzoquinol methylase
MSYTEQVTVNHYKESYDNKERFISYFNQKNLVLSLIKKFPNPKDVKVLEIGKGNGFLDEYLRKNGVNIKTLDISPDLKPDIVGDILTINETLKDKFDIVVCFETLEHIKYEDAVKAVEEISKLTTKYFIMSVPQYNLYFSFWFKLPILQTIKYIFQIPFPAKHTFDGQHYWELGKAGYSVSKVRVMLKRFFNLNYEYTDPLDHYHHFFVLEKK